MAEPSDDSNETLSCGSSLHTGEGVVIDIGTGDGHFVYQCARENPKKFFIGIDANPRPLEKVSEKIHRNPAKGGLPNALFLQAAIEDLPSELDGIADEVHIHFPWGSLLRVVANGEEVGLSNVRRICSPEALLEVVIGLDRERDLSEIQRLGLKPLSTSYIDRDLIPRYRAAGFEILERGVLERSDWTRLRSSWAKRLRVGDGREVTYILARAASQSCD